jgi:DNA-directed RNA polymerase sigma subunit (sigma70/sigma32)
LTTIGRRHGITRERARQLRDRAIEKLRNSQDMQQLIDYV